MLRTWAYHVATPCSEAPEWFTVASAQEVFFSITQLGWDLLLKNHACALSFDVNVLRRSRIGRRLTDQVSSKKLSS